MALMMLTLIGLVLGWIASVIVRAEERGPILRQMGLGLAVSVTCGLIANSGTFLGSLSWIAMGVAVALTIAALAAYSFYLNRRSA